MRLDRIYKLISLLAIEYQCDVTNDIELFNSWDHLYGFLERGRLMKFLNLFYNCLESQLQVEIRLESTLF